MLSRPRVVMFLPSDVTFGHDWADAASLRVDVIRIEEKRQLTFPVVKEYRFLARSTANPSHYQLKRAAKPPRRLLGPLSDVPATVRAMGALDYLEEEHGRIDLLHAHFYPTARFFPWIRRRTGIPFVVTEHSTALTLESPDKKITSRGRRIAARVYADAAFVIPVSESLKDAIERLGLIGNFRVIPNPVDSSLFHPVDKKMAKDRIQLVTVSRLARVKGIDILLTAVSQLRDKSPLKLTIVGAGPLDAELKTMRDEMGLQGVVEFVGHQDRPQIATRLSESDIFVLASRIENLPVVVIEALMSGLPVVATSVGGIPELLGEQPGYLAERENPTAFADALQAAIDALPWHDRRSTAEQAIAIYSMEAVGEQLAKLYDEVLGVEFS